MWEDEDTLFATSAQEVENRDPGGVTMGAITSEIMWDAILARGPEQRLLPPPRCRRIQLIAVRLRLQRKDLAIPLDIVVAREPNKAILEVRAEVGKLAIEAIGGGQAFEFSHLRDKMNDWTSSTFTNAREGQLERE